MRFDENYGIEVFDGDECFKLEGFSGGERDVVALCARLAMSELVGSSALRPPRFLVLDEVFGSLDSERRSQLLETLGSLAYGGSFPADVHHQPRRRRTAVAGHERGVDDRGAGRRQPRGAP